MIGTEYTDLVKEMEKAANRFYNLRYQMSNGGNLSIRVPGKDWMLVKGTDVAFDEVSMDTVVVADFDGNMVEGTGRPSKEALLHGAIYKKMQNVNAIMHCHSPYATAWAAHHDKLAFSTYHSQMKLHKDVPVFDTQSYAVPKEWFARILSVFEADADTSAFLLKGHGQITVGRDMRMAAHLAELVEETAQISILSSLYDR